MVLWPQRWQAGNCNSCLLYTSKALYDEDAGKELRKSHLNPIVQEVYANYLGAWGGEKAHHILHTKYYAQPKYRL